MSIIFQMRSAALRKFGWLPVRSVVFGVVFHARPDSLYTLLMKTPPDDWKRVVAAFNTVAVETADETEVP